MVNCLSPIYAIQALIYDFFLVESLFADTLQSGLVGSRQAQAQALLTQSDLTGSSQAQALVGRPNQSGSSSSQKIEAQLWILQEECALQSSLHQLYQPSQGKRCNPFKGCHGLSGVAKGDN